jgi:cell division septation protein DedD
VTEPRTHYQISLTSRQAVFLFAGLLVALAGAFFLGLMTGLPARDARGEAPAEEARAAAPAPASAAASSDALPPIETAVPTAAVASNALRAAATPPPAEPTAPPTLQPFDDGASEEAASPLVDASPGKSPPSHAAAAHPGAGRYWVQVASLTSRQEASALSGRLSKRGYRSQVLSADAPKGKGRVYRVRVGPYPSEDEAGKAAGRLNKQERIASPWVVPEGK